MGYLDQGMNSRRMLFSVVLIATQAVGCGKWAGVTEAKLPVPVLAEAELEPQNKELWATIVIESSPRGMAALLDGKPVGKTPISVDRLKPGRYDVTIKDEANGDVTMNVQLGEGEYRTVKHNVVPRADSSAPASAKQ